MTKSLSRSEYWTIYKIICPNGNLKWGTTGHSKQIKAYVNAEHPTLERFIETHLDSFLGVAIKLKATLKGLLSKEQYHFYRIKHKSIKATIHKTIERLADIIENPLEITLEEDSMSSSDELADVSIKQNKIISLNNDLLSGGVAPSTNLPKSLAGVSRHHGTEVVVEPVLVVNELVEDEPEQNSTKAIVPQNKFVPHAKPNRKSNPIIEPTMKDILYESDEETATPWTELDGPMNTEDFEEFDQSIPSPIETPKPFRKAFEYNESKIHRRHRLFNEHMNYYRRKNWKIIQSGVRKVALERQEKLLKLTEECFGAFVDPADSNPICPEGEHAMSGDLCTICFSTFTPPLTPEEQEVKDKKSENQIKQRANEFDIEIENKIDSEESFGDPYPAGQQTDPDSDSPPLLIGGGWTRRVANREYKMYLSELSDSSFTDSSESDSDLVLVSDALYNKVKLQGGVDEKTPDEYVRDILRNRYPELEEWHDLYDSERDEIERELGLESTRAYTRFIDYIREQEAAAEEPTTIGLDLDETESDFETTDEELEFEEQFTEELEDEQFPNFDSLDSYQNTNSIIQEDITYLIEHPYAEIEYLLGDTYTEQYMKEIIRNMHDEADRDYSYNIEIWNQSSSGIAMHPVGRRLNKNTLMEMFKLINGQISSRERTSKYKSSEEILDEISRAYAVRITLVRAGRERRSGGFFSYVHKIPNLDLTQLQIYNEAQRLEVVDEDLCVIKSLEQQFKGTEEELKIMSNELRSCFLKSGTIHTTNLKNVAKILECRIKVKWLQKNGASKPKTYGKKGPIYKLALFDRHYIRNDIRIPVTKYAIEHYTELQNEKDWHKIIGPTKTGYQITNNAKRFLEPFKLVKLLLENKDECLADIQLYMIEKLTSQIQNKIGDYVADALVYKEKNHKGYQEKLDSLILNRNLFHDHELDMFTGLTKADQRLIELDSEIRVGENDDVTFVDSDIHLFENKRKRKILETLLTPAVVAKIESDLRSGKETTVKIDKKYNVCFFDYETDVTKRNHIPIALSYKLNNEPTVNLAGSDSNLLTKQMCEKLPQNTLMIAHHIDFDYRFLIKYLYTTENFIHFNGKLMTGEFAYWNKKHEKIRLYLKCSHSLISKPLRDFAKMFNLGKMEKEVMPYKLYTTELMSKSSCKISKALDVLKEQFPLQADFQENSKQFLENIKSLDMQNKDKFDHVAYLKYYCGRDVNVLCLGYNKFRANIKFICKEHLIPLDADKQPSISSIGHKIMVNEGAYQDVYKIGGTVRDFIQKSVRGGRVMTHKNKKLRIEGKNVWEMKDGVETLLKSYDEDIKLVDFDGVSLYPSAMAAGQGCLKGTPKVLKTSQLTKEFLAKTDGYFVRVKITKVGKHRDMPLLPLLEDGKYIYDDTCWIGKTFVVSHIALEDLIEFQQIEFDIVSGVYFNEGYNTKIKSSIEMLFNTRLQYKKQKNDIQEIYKLCMNSVYGKLVLKPIKKKVKFFNNDEDKEKYIQYNINNIDTFQKIGDKDSTKWMVKEFVSLMEHKSYVHIGSIILDESKRIMNRVICLAEDLGITIFYQDTDSMHLVQSELPILIEAYKQKYGKDLVGGALGQFHEDFDTPDGSDLDAYAIESIFLGKKSYFDNVVYKKDGSSEPHSRMKGVPNKSIKVYAEENNLTIKEIYNKLYRGEAIEFDLLKGGCKFVKNSDLTISSRECTSNPEFKRKVQF